MNNTFKEIRKKAKSNNKKRPFISMDEVLLLRREYDLDDELLITEIFKWLNSQNIEIKEFDNLDTYLKNEVKKIDEKKELPFSIIVDRLTPTCLNIMNNIVTGKEQPIVYYLAKGILTNNKRSYFLTTKELSKQLRMNSKEISVYLSNLIKKGIVVAEPINSKNFAYSINSELFIAWFYFRYKLKKK